MILFNDLPRVKRTTVLFKLKIQAFSRLDLLVIMVVVLLLGSCFVYANTGEKARIARCTNNLMVLGQTMRDYAGDHHDELPVAMPDLRRTRISWDTQLFPYLTPKMEPTTSDYANRKHLLDIAHWFFCPSDQQQRTGLPRSYAMAEFEMSLNAWHSGRDSVSASGLFGNTNVLAVNQEEKTKSDSALTWIDPRIQDPANTFLLTELPDIDNQLGQVEHSYLTLLDQVSIPQGFSHFHGGRFNYLMADGHVELLTPFQIGLSDGLAGISSISQEN